MRAEGRVGVGVGVNVSCEGLGPVSKQQRGGEIENNLELLSKHQLIMWNKMEVFICNT